MLIMFLKFTCLANSLSMVNVPRLVSLGCDIVLRKKFFICASLLKLLSAEAAVTGIVQNNRSAMMTLLKTSSSLKLEMLLSKVIGLIGAEPKFASWMAFKCFSSCTMSSATTPLEYLSAKPCLIVQINVR